MTVFILISLLWHPACFFLRTPSSLTYMELLLLPSNISVAREIDTPFMAWIQPSTMSRVYTYDTTLMKNSLRPQCEILAPRTTSKIAMNWTDAPKLASSARSLCSVSDYSESLTLHWAFSSSLWMFISLCSWGWSGAQENPLNKHRKEIFKRAHPSSSHFLGCPAFCSQSYYPSLYTSYSCLVKLR